MWVRDMGQRNGHFGGNALEAALANPGQAVDVTLKLASSLPWWPCCVCGEDVRGWWKGSLVVDGVELVVCQECVKAGSEALPGRLLAQAEGHEAIARGCRAAANWTWTLPSPSAAQAFQAELDEGFMEFLRRERPQEWAVLQEFDVEESGP